MKPIGVSNHWQHILDLRWGRRLIYWINAIKFWHKIVSLKNYIWESWFAWLALFYYYQIIHCCPRTPLIHSMLNSITLPCVIAGEIFTFYGVRADPTRASKKAWTPTAMGFGEARVNSYQTSTAIKFYFLYFLHTQQCEMVSIITLDSILQLQHKSNLLLSRRSPHLFLTAYNHIFLLLRGCKSTMRGDTPNKLSF